MVRIFMSLALLVAIVPSLYAQGSQRGTRPGDTVSVVVHKVRAEKRAQYDSLMRNVWWPASQKAGKKYPPYRKYASGRRRYVATEMASDSTFTYLYLYFGTIELPEPAGGGNRVLRAAGLSKAQSDSFAQAIRAYTAASAGGPLVDEPYK
jgi:hypothetical protein